MRACALWSRSLLGLEQNQSLDLTSTPNFNDYTSASKPRAYKVDRLRVLKV